MGLLEPTEQVLWSASGDSVKCELERNLAILANGEQFESPSAADSDEDYEVEL